MIILLSEKPHCDNCKNLRKKRNRHHCSGLNEYVHPESCGHMTEKLDEAISAFKVHCEKYIPQEHIRA